MRLNRTPAAPMKTCVVVLTADAGFEHMVRTTFSASPQIDLRIISATVAGAGDKIDVNGATVVVIDLDARRDDEMAAMQRLMARTGGWPPVVVITQTFDADVARTLLQMRVADFLVKPVSAVELVRTCARVAHPVASETTEAEIYTFLAAVGGAGVTTLAIQTALLLLASGPRGRSSTCLVDLNFQHGACADYLDLEPRLDISEIEPSPDRLDRQLLEVMTSYHASGLAVIAAPNHPAEMRSFDPDVVTRLLDLVSTHFDYVVIDMPRTWFSWTDSVLLGSNKLFIVSEMTVPGIKHAKQLVEAIRERMTEGPSPQVIVNRFEQRLFTTGLTKKDIENALGKDFVAVVPNFYRLVREAIDRGVPLEEVKRGNKITRELKKLIAPAPVKDAAPKPQPEAKKLSLSLAR
ncbi:MAG: response regulator receiver protein [Pseudorhodoplanes sp.]|nr:MAG: response regulator [Pseudorhodoplanes sp.]MBZ0140618.1 response regulator receiver protein [Pseudorhodoplanes sp.]